MKTTDTNLVTPIYLKTEEGAELPDDPAAYVLTSSGLYLTRNHGFFKSCVPAPRWPQELAPHSASLALNYPKIGRQHFELILGFFTRMAEWHGAEAGVLLLFDRKAKQIRYYIPRQQATVSKSWTGHRFPVDLKYDVPPNLGPDRCLIGDIHSHADQAAYASYKDQLDETHLPGIHLVVGHLLNDPPDIHCEFVVDGYRFAIAPETVLEGYKRRRFNVPQEWFDRVEIKPLSFTTGNQGTGDSQGGHQGNFGNYDNYADLNPDPGQADQEDSGGGSVS